MKKNKIPITEAIFYIKNKNYKNLPEQPSNFYRVLAHAIIKNSTNENTMRCPSKYIDALL